MALQQIMIYDKYGSNIAPLKAISGISGTSVIPINASITDGIYATNSPDTRLFTGYSNVSTLSTGTNPIQIDLGAATEITGVSIITSPNSVPSLIGSQISLRDASNQPLQTLILKGDQVREDFIMTYTNNVVARYIRIENPPPSFFATNEYDPTLVGTGYITIQSFQAFDIYGRDVLTAKPYSVATNSNYSSSVTTTYIGNILTTNARYVEYDLGQEYTLFSVKMTSTLPVTPDTNQNVKYRFMKNAPIVFYNAARNQTSKYFLTDPYIPQNLAGSAAAALPYLKVSNQGNFGCSTTDPASSIQIWLNPINNSQSITITSTQPGTLNWSFTGMNASGGASMTISGIGAPNPVNGNANNNPVSYTGSVSLPSNKHTITLTLNASDTTNYNNALGPFNSAVSAYQYAYDVESHCIYTGFYQHWA